MSAEPFKFYGRVGRPNPKSDRTQAEDNTPEGMWCYRSDDFAIAVRGPHARTTAGWLQPTERPNSTFVFVAGSVYLSSDTEYGESTLVSPLAIESAPDVIARHFDAYGTRTFALLDGDFSLVVWDRSSQSAYLAVDKLGCNDIYLRRYGDSFLFASQPSDLFQKNEQFESVILAFLLAHEGFIPSPFTLSAEVKALGRSRFAKISASAGKVECEIKSYWRPADSWNLPSTAVSREKFFSLFQDSVAARTAANTAVLLSGGADSTLIMNLAARSSKANILAVTGSIKGWEQGEEEIALSQSIAQSLRVPHQRVILDPLDGDLPEESLDCSLSWMNGVRLSLPLWRRLALCLSERLGEGYNVIAGQTADTLADNNYTFPSAGYNLRRTLFSPWFLRTMPFLKLISPQPDGIMGRMAIGCMNWLGGNTKAAMLDSILRGMCGRDEFLAGRVFGYREMPGISRAYFPTLTRHGFESTAGWYVANFIQPLLESLDSSNFYCQMIQMSMDMNMLHLDSRLLFHIYRQEGGRAQLPFMDARFVNFFGSIPYYARAFYREPKHLIRCQLRRKGMISAPQHSKKSSNPSKRPEQLLLQGTLGEYYRDLLRHPTFPDRSRHLFDYLDQEYFEEQVNRFGKGGDEIDYSLIAKLGTVELWSRSLSDHFDGQLENHTAPICMKPTV